mmetsp:Transcript_2716/g.3733  ORF Transcript_2716/g.3733 Transcript_2716/m.3733 type:complete len:120 (-) Transcript_2716:9-368(-)
MPNFEEIQQQQQQQREYEERRTMILNQILDSGAQERLARLSLVKKEKARTIEDSLIKAATNGQLKGKVTEEQLIVMLEQISGPSENSEGAKAGKKSIIIQRRKYDGIDDDDNDDDSDLI